MDDLTMKVFNVTVGFIRNVAELMRVECKMVDSRYSANKKITAMSIEARRQWNDLKTIHEVVLMLPLLKSMGEYALKLEDLLIKNKCGDKKVRELLISSLNTHKEVEVWCNTILNGDTDMSDWLKIDISEIKPFVEE